MIYLVTVLVCVCYIANKNVDIHSELELVIVHCREKSVASSVSVADQPSHSEPPRQSHPVQPQAAVSTHPRQSFVDDLPPADSFG